MDLKSLAKIVYRRAIEKQQKGEVPTFLGVKGLLALMHNNIVKYHEEATTDTGGDYVLDLCVHGLFALQCIVPDINDSDNNEGYEDIQEEGSDNQTDGGDSESRNIEPDGDNTGRFTTIQPGQSIKDIKEQ